MFLDIKTSLYLQGYIKIIDPVAEGVNVLSANYIGVKFLKRQRGNAKRSKIF